MCAARPVSCMNSLINVLPFLCFSISLSGTITITPEYMRRLQAAFDVYKQRMKACAHFNNEWNALKYLFFKSSLQSFKCGVLHAYRVENACWRFRNNVLAVYKEISFLSNNRVIPLYWRRGGADFLLPSTARSRVRLQVPAFRWRRNTNFLVYCIYGKQLRQKETYSRFHPRRHLLSYIYLHHVRARLINWCFQDLRWSDVR